MLHCLYAFTFNFRLLTGTPANANRCSPNANIFRADANVFLVMSTIRSANANANANLFDWAKMAKLPTVTLPPLPPLPPNSKFFVSRFRRFRHC
jgi:hypothetical protein